VIGAKADHARATTATVAVAGTAATTSAGGRPQDASVDASGSSAAMTRPRPAPLAR
jgi:hypothetical protein